MNAGLWMMPPPCLRLSQAYSSGRARRLSRALPPLEAPKPGSSSPTEKRAVSKERSARNVEPKSGQGMTAIPQVSGWNYPTSWEIQGTSRSRSTAWARGSVLVSCRVLGRRRPVLLVAMQGWEWDVPADLRIKQCLDVT